MVMEVTELSLAATNGNECVVEKSMNSCMMSESENNPSRKRKYFSDQLFKSTSTSTTGPAAAEAIQTSVDLQLKDPLPLDWEQCLDLESGRMYYMNRKTLRKSWNWPENKKQKLDLELNISTLSSNCSHSLDHHEYSNKHQYSSSGGRSNNNNNMVALACLNCHLLVILSKSSPSCPNCKYVHSFPTLQTQPPPNLPAPKSPNTLSLLKY
ncbi:hypothetical protein ACOSQ2_007305 [Xanthoceras sorbifolium]